VDFDMAYLLLIIYSVVIKYFRKNGNATGQCISYYKLQNAGGEEVLYNKHIVFGIQMKLID